MKPVCPACRAAIAIDASTCWRCGLSVRPTCGVCGEPLAHGMQRCWSCGTSLDSGDIEVGGRAARKRKSRAGLIVFEGICAGLLLTIGLLAFEAMSMRFVDPPAASIALKSQRFDDLHFTIDAPSDWTVTEVDKRASFEAPETLPQPRGMRIALIPHPFSEVRKQIAALADGLPDYRKIDVVDVTIDGRRATRHRYISGGVVYEQVWVENKKAMMLLQFWESRFDDQARVLNDRIAASLDIR